MGAKIGGEYEYGGLGEVLLDSHATFFPPELPLVATSAVTTKISLLQKVSRRSSPADLA